MYLSRKVFDRHGYTDGCKGCLDLASAKPRVGSFLSPHNAACRRRMEAAIKATEPDRRAIWLLRRGQEEAARDEQVLAHEASGAPSGPADLVAVVTSESEPETLEEEIERKPGRQEE